MSGLNDVHRQGRTMGIVEVERCTSFNPDIVKHAASKYIYSMSLNNGVSSTQCFQKKNGKMFVYVFKH